MEVVALRGPARHDRTVAKVGGDMSPIGAGEQLRATVSRDINKADRAVTYSILDLAELGAAHETCSVVIEDPQMPPLEPAIYAADHQLQVTVPVQVSHRYGLKN